MTIRTGTGSDAPNLARDLHAVQLWQREVDDQEVGRQLDGPGHRLPPGCRFAADGPSRHGLEDGAHPLPHQLVVVRDNDSYWL